MGNRSIVGWASGTAMDSQDTLAFSVLTGVRSLLDAIDAAANAVNDREDVVGRGAEEFSLMPQYT